MQLRPRILFDRIVAGLGRRRPRVLLIGGSNSIFRSGYVGRMTGAMKAADGRGIELHDMAVGGAYSPIAFAQFARFTAWDSLDCVILEYALNDERLVAGGPEFLTYWRRTYEGVMRQVVERAPRARLLNIVLEGGGTSTAFAEGRPRPLFETVEALSRRYGAAVFDATRYLVETCGMTPDALAGSYKDSRHYDEAAAALIGQGAAAALAAVLRDAPLAPASPLDPEHFGRTRYLPAEALAYSGPSPIPDRLVNSRTDVSVLRLHAGTSFVLPETDRFVGLLYAAEAASPFIDMTIGGERLITTTRRNAAGNERFPFLISLYLPDPFGKKVFPRESPAADRVTVLETSAVEVKENLRFIRGGRIGWALPTREPANLALLGALVLPVEAGRFTPDSPI
jgi:hypothetical protein